MPTLLRKSIENTLENVNEYTAGPFEREHYLSMKAMILGLFGNLFQDDIICQSIAALGSGQNIIAIVEELTTG